MDARRRNGAVTAAQRVCKRLVFGGSLGIRREELVQSFEFGREGAHTFPDFFRVGAPGFEGTPGRLEFRPGRFEVTGGSLELGLDLEALLMGARPTDSRGHQTEHESANDET